jgi:hypothetical protein
MGSNETKKFTLFVPVHGQINPPDEFFCAEIGRLSACDYTFSNIRGEKGEIYHPGNIALVFTFF